PRIDAFLNGMALDASTRVQVNGLDETLAQALAGRQLPARRDQLIGLQPQALVDALVPIGSREYSIASISSDGVLELIVRQERRADGNLGLGSGWLTEYLPLNGTLSLRLRRNSGFHLPESAAPMILIGNGTGLAGLRRLMRARVTAGEQRNW